MSIIEKFISSTKKVSSARLPQMINRCRLHMYWNSLTEQEKNTIVHYYKKYYNENIYTSKFREYPFGLLFSFLVGFYTMKEYGGCAKTLQYIENNNVQSNEISDLHFLYIYAVRFLYQPTKPENNTEKAKEYCYKDIDLVLNNLKAIKKIGDGELPNIPTVKTLVVILEKEKNYVEAIRICDIAIKLGLDDKTQGGYVGRKEKLLKKQLS